MNMQQMVQAMQKAQKEFNKEYAKIEAKEYVANPNGVVEVKILGDFTVNAVNVLDEDLLKPENKKELSDMICLAYNKAKDMINADVEALNARFQKSPGGLMF